MNKFSCHKCGKCFAQKINLEYHLQKKNPCDKFLKKSGISVIDEKEIDKQNKIDYNNNDSEIIDAQKLREYMDNLKCVYCKKEFKRKICVLNHIKNNCKRVKEIEEERNNIFLKLKQEKEAKEIQKKIEEEETNKIKLLENEISILKSSLENKDKKLQVQEKKFEKKLQKEISKIKKSITKISNQNSNNINNINNINSNNINSNNTDNSINNNQQNIILTNYTGSGMPPLQQEEIIPLLKRGFQTAVELTKKVHFNPKYPEFHNVFIPRINETNGMIFIENAWKIIDRDELVNDIYEHKRAYVIENLDTYIDKLDDNKKKSLKRWLDRDDNDEGVINTKKDIKKLLYDNRHMAMVRKKEFEKQNKKVVYTSFPKKVKSNLKEDLILNKNDSDSDSEDYDSSYYSDYSYDSSNISSDKSESDSE
jgi:hypothetical protein